MTVKLLVAAADGPFARPGLPGETNRDVPW